MKIVIFKTLRLRLKRWLGRVEFLGRARRQAATRLTLPDLEREVRAHMGVALTAKSRPPRFAALRYTFFGDWGLAPWITDYEVRKTYALTNNAPSGRSADYGFTGLSDVHFWSTLCVLAFVIAVINGGDSDSERAYVLIAIFGSLTLVRSMSRMKAARRHIKHNATHSEIREARVPVGTPVSAAIAQYVAHRLEGVKEGIVGKRTRHAKTRERADGELREARAKWTQLHLRIRQRYGEGISDDASVELTDEQVPAHLRVLREELRLILRRAEDTLRKLDEFESNVTAALDELGAEARADLVLYEDLDLIEGVRQLGGRVEQTARDARRSIAQALDSLQERMEALREDVVRREELIGSIVAVLPSAPNRDAEWQRLEDVVSGLSLPPRQKTLA